MKKKILFLVLCTFAFFGFGSPVDDIIEADEVMIVGKITVTVRNKDFDFFTKSFGIKNFDEPHCYDIYDDSYVKTGVLHKGEMKILSNYHYNTYQANEYFLSKRKNAGDEFYAVTPVKWHFYGSNSFVINLPFYFKASIPKNAKYIYVGDFDFTVEGDDFEVTDISVDDTYDQAKKELKKLYGMDVGLTRVQIEPIN